MTRAGLIPIPLVLLVSGSICAQPLDSLPAYRPASEIAGTIRVWGSAQMAELMQRWQSGFADFHPNVRFENHLNGAVSAIAGIYTGVADLALSREIWPLETLAFEQVIGHKPSAIEVATGSFDVPTKSDSLEIFIHKDNPISKVTLSQIDAIFGAEHLRGAKNFRVWGDLGLKGEWTGKPINGYGFKFENAGAMVFSDVVLKGSRIWNCDVKGFANVVADDGTRVDAGRLILDALSRDRYGIAISNIHYARGDVKVLPVGLYESGPFVSPTRETVRDRTYPLFRSVYIFLNRPPREPIDPRLKEFLRYVLSRNGQLDVTAEGAYLPLPVKIARANLVSIE